MSPLLEVQNIGKSFPGVTALQEVSFKVNPGEVRALMGENGAGKSTLLKILSGEYEPDEGEIIVDGSRQRFSCPRDSQAAGIAIIHQELQLAPELTVAENLMLGIMPTRNGILDTRAMRERARSILGQLGEPIDPDYRLGDLSIGKRQMVEIGKALLRNAKIIAFDEPTSSLSLRETETLKRIVSDLRQAGCAIIYVSHRMEEVFEISDSVTVLRDGRHVDDWIDMKKLTSDELISAMAGRTISDVYAYRPRPKGKIALEVKNLLGPGLSSPVNLQLHRGEVLGVFGLVGAGRSELFRIIAGADSGTSGEIFVDGERLSGGCRPAIAAGLGLCPEDRKDAGIIPLASVRENVVIARRNLNSSSWLLSTESERRNAISAIADMRIKTASAETPIATLSGGNQQKAIIARWLSADSELLLFDEPTRGIDVGARSEIYDHIFRLAENGKAVLFASSDMPEILGIADRIIVMREGAIVGEVGRGEATPETLLRLALPDSTSRAA